MKRGKDGEKVMGPMFPRLHVNDADKGGPRAPPRNKMALYEQLCIPSQRFSPGLLLGSPNVNNPVPPSSSSQVNDADRKIFFPLHLPLSKSAFLPEKLSGLESDRSNSNASLTQLGQHNEPDDEDDCTVPVFARSRDAQGKNQERTNNRSFMATRIQTLNTGQEKEPAEHENVDGEPRAVDKSYHEGENNEYMRETVANASEPRRDSQSGNTERSDDVSEASILDSVSTLDISPDHVVGIIGQKHFWKARKAIVNQQRVFAVQVFELHRLIKVQKLIAGSPHLRMEDTSTLSKPSSRSPLAARLMVENDIKSMSPATKHRDEPHKPTHPVECSAENAVGRPPVFSSKSASLGPPVVPNSSPWGPSQQQPTGQQQWLIPVMSPTEGLVYKPYPGAALNSTGFCMPYGSSPMMMGNFGNPAYGVPTHQGMGFIPGIPRAGHSYFPTYGMPVMNMGVSGAGSGSISAVEPVNRPTEPIPVIQPGHVLRQEPSRPTEPTPGIQPGHVLRQEPSPRQLQSSCNNGSVPVPRNTPNTPRLQTSKVSEKQGSTGSSPHNTRAEPTRTASSVNPRACNEARGAEPVSSSLREKEPGNAQIRDGKDELPLFPTAPATAEPDQLTQVIRAVPHNARSASASVARIFRFIQEERKQYDSV